MQLNAGDTGLAEFRGDVWHRAWTVKRAFSRVRTALQLQLLTLTLALFPGFAVADSIPRLAEHLSADGQLQLPKGFSGSLDPAGLTMVQRAGEQPRFLPRTVGSASKLFGVPGGCNAEVTAIAAAPSGLIYLAGEFTACEDAAASFVVAYDPRTRRFSTLGTRASNGTNAGVVSLAVLGNDLYVGGFFTEAGGQPANRIARWDGRSWSALGSGLRTTEIGVLARATALVVLDGSLYVGGAFTEAGGVPASNIARWDGRAWTALGNAAGNGVNGRVRALAVQSGSVFVGGNFSQAGGQSAMGIARWNGSSWSSLGNGVNGGDANVQALAVAGADLYAGGNFSRAGTVSANNIARWNGNAWASLGTGANNGVNQEVYALAIDGPGVYVGGLFTQAGGLAANYLARWNGSNWTALSTQAGNGASLLVSSMAVIHGDLYFGGLFPLVGDNLPALRVARWDGSVFSALGNGSGNGVDSQVLSLALYADDLYAGGLFSRAGASAANGIARWNGSRFSALISGSDNGVFGPVYAMTAYRGELVAAGGFPGNRRNIFSWNGSRFAALGSASNNGANDDIRAVLVDGDSLFVAGSFTEAGGVTANRIARWDGSSWSALGSGSNNGVNGRIRALAGTANSLYVGGEFTEAGGQPANRVARWNGSSWSALGSGPGNGVDALVAAIALLGDDVYVGGQFTRAGGQSAGALARFNGSTWSAVSGADGIEGMDAAVAALAVAGTDLYVGGFFFNAAGQRANGLARFDGSNWQGLATGEPRQFVQALLVDGQTLRVGGSGLIETPLADVQSRSASGALANAASRDMTISRNALKTAFTSEASNLVAGGSNNLSDVYLRDQRTGVITKVSPTTPSVGGAQQGFSNPVLSADGNQIAFSSSAGQLLALINGQNRTISSSASGVMGNGPSGRVSLPGAGTLAFFDSQASNLLAASAGDGNGAIADIFVKDIASGAVTLISTGLGGASANGPSTGPAATDDGQMVAFSTLATNLVPDGAIASHHKNGTVGQTVMIGGAGQSRFYLSRNTSTLELGNGDSVNVRLTPSGRFGVFESDATNLVSGDTNGVRDIFRFEAVGNQLAGLERVSTSRYGLQSNGPSRNASISDDGQYITFETDASNLVELDGNNVTDVVVKWMVSGEVLRLSGTVDGQQPNGASGQPMISGDGAVIVFDSAATNLTEGDVNNATDVFAVRLRDGLPTFDHVSGWYWDPAQSGRGYFFEKKSSGSVFMAGFLYEVDGRALWFTAQGAMDGNVFSSVMNTFTSGQTLTGPYSPPIAGPLLGNITLDFSSDDTAQLNMPGTSISLLRFPFATGSVQAPAPAGAPQNGWWWSAAEAGRGYAIEFQGNQIFIIAFMYNDVGQPIWYLANGTMASTTRFTGSWSQFANGQALGQPYQAPVQINPDAGSVIFDFDSAATGTLTLPDGRAVGIVRFPF